MSIVSRARAAYRAFVNPAKLRRGFDAAATGRLWNDWFASATSSDAEIRASFRRLLDRSRDHERNNDYVRAFLASADRNVNGAIRYDLRADCGEYSYAKGKAPQWVPDRIANSLIESAWIEWGKRGSCTVDGKYSWRDVRRLLVRSVARDGNFIARKIVGRAAGNRFGFALQLWEIDHLDTQKNERLSNGNEVRFGVELDALRKPVAFWLFAQHPGDTGLNLATSSVNSQRFEADDIYHVFISDRIEQSIGYPWIVSAITRLRQLGAFEEAAVVAARIGASKGIYFERGVGPNGELGEWTGETNAAGAPTMPVEPGMAEALPEGWKVADYSPEYPNIETGEFRKAMLRGISSALSVSYNTLGNDLESVNFSSARVGLFEEREAWKTLQLFFNEAFFEPVYHDWLTAAISAGAVNLPMAKFQKFDRPVFKNRRWPFVDPYKEILAANEGVNLRITSRRQIIEENGGDVEDVFHDNKDDENLAADIGLDLSAPDAKPVDEPDDDEGAPAKPPKGPKQNG